MDNKWGIILLFEGLNALAISTLKKECADLAGGTERVHVSGAENYSKPHLAQSSQLGCHTAYLEESKHSHRN